MGQFAVATEHGEHALELFDLEQERALVSLFQLSSSVACGVFHSQSLWFLGHVEDAQRRHAETWALVEALDHPTSMAYGMGVCIFLHYARRDRETIAEWAERLFTLCEEQGFVLWSAQARMYRGWAQGMAGDPVGGLREFDEGFEGYRRTGAALMEPQFRLMTAELLWKAGRADDALGSIAEALRDADRLGERVYEPELHRLRGEIEIEGGAVDRGEASLAQSIEVARAQEARMLELRAALVLARLRIDQGRSGEVSALLGPLVAWFEAGADEAELREARALLGG
jgi:predicted ATPase